MMVATVTTGANNDTVTLEMVPYRGQLVFLDVEFRVVGECPHELDAVHHLGDDGHHWCPTMFIMCGLCGAVGHEPEPYECELWDELA